MALTNLEIKNAKPGFYADGGGLYLQVKDTGAKSWIFRYQLNGKRREMGIGSVSEKPATQARALAGALKVLVKEGIDPINRKRDEQAEKVIEAKKATLTFMKVAREYIEKNRSAWKNAKHVAQWDATLETYAAPVFKDTPIDQIDTDMVLKVLTPIWSTKTETASRVRSRIELVMAYAKAMKYYSGENPATWLGNLKAILPAAAKVQTKRHHPALPYEQVADFMTELRTRPGAAARALELAILTASRQQETLLATWSEIDLEKRVWIRPEDHMKMGREHRVPLSQEVVDLLKALPRYTDTDLLFPGDRSRKVLSNMAVILVIRRMNAIRKAKDLPRWIDPKQNADVVPHGFRSTFKDWASETTTYPNEMSEIALAHAIGDKTEEAYRRRDMFERRREMMDSWARYCRGGAGNVVSINGGKTQRKKGATK